MTDVIHVASTKGTLSEMQRISDVRRNVTTTHENSSLFLRSIEILEVDVVNGCIACRGVRRRGTQLTNVSLDRNMGAGVAGW